MTDHTGICLNFAPNRRFLYCTSTIFTLRVDMANGRITCSVSAVGDKHFPAVNQRSVDLQGIVEVSHVGTGTRMTLTAIRIECQVFGMRTGAHRGIVVTKRTTGSAGIPIGKLAVVGRVVASRIGTGIIGRVPGRYTNGRFVGQRLSAILQLLQISTGCHRDVRGVGGVGAVAGQTGLTGSNVLAVGRATGATAGRGVAVASRTAQGRVVPEAVYSGRSMTSGCTTLVGAVVIDG